MTDPVSDSGRLIVFTPTLDGFAFKPRGIDFRSHHYYETKPCETEPDFVDRLRVGWLWEGYHESRRCSRDTYPESCITKYTTYTKINGRDRAGGVFFFFISLKPRVE